MSFTIDPTFECVGKWPCGADYPEGTEQITLLPPGQGPQLTWVLYSDDAKVLDQFEMGKTYNLTLTVKEVPCAASPSTDGPDGRGTAV